jgi:hypothetical protein
MEPFAAKNKRTRFARRYLWGWKGPEIPEQSPPSNRPIPRTAYLTAANNPPRLLMFIGRTAGFAGGGCRGAPAIFGVAIWSSSATSINAGAHEGR